MSQLSQLIVLAHFSDESGARPDLDNDVTLSKTPDAAANWQIRFPRKPVPPKTTRLRCMRQCSVSTGVE